MENIIRKITIFIRIKNLIVRCGGAAIISYEEHIIDGSVNINACQSICAYVSN